MPERIVDVLELVEIETEHGDGFGAPLAAERRFHPFVERHAVRQVRERIVVRQVLDFFLGGQSLGDVLVGGNPAAVRERLVYNGNDPAIGQVRDFAKGFSMSHCRQKLGPISLDTSA